MTALELKGTEAETTASYMEVRGRLAESVVAALADQVSRKIVSSTSNAPLSVAEISSYGAIPISTCYRRMTELVEEGLMVVDRIVMTSEGRYAKYSSSFSGFKVLSFGGGFSVEVALNERVAEKVRKKWISMGTQCTEIAA